MKKVLAEATEDDLTLSEALKIVFVRYDTTIPKVAQTMKKSRQTLYGKFERNSFTQNDLNQICDALGIKYRIVFEPKEDDDEKSSE